MAWNKGLTKEDPRVQKYASKLNGRVFTPEWKAKISIAHKGKPLTVYHRNQISKSLSGRKRSYDERLKISLGLRDRKFSNETKEKMRQAKLGKKHSKRHRDKIINSWTLEKRREASLRRSKQKLPLKDTKIELQVQSILKDANIEFKTHYPINLKFMIHQVDIFIKPNKIIEVFGTYHHADPRFYSPDEVLKVKGHSTAKEIWDEDSKIIESLWKKNFRVLVVYQDDLKKHYQQIKNWILDFSK